MHQLLEQISDWCTYPHAHRYRWALSMYSSFPPTKATRGVEDVPGGQWKENRWDEAPRYHQTSPTAAHLEKRKCQEFCQKKQYTPPLQKNPIKHQKTPNQTQICICSPQTLLPIWHQSIKEQDRFSKPRRKQHCLPASQDLQQAAFANVGTKQQQTAKIQR